ncbi:MAG TPA: hypothetical protein PLZ58_00390 [Candidatus Saccharibacteria bacterium]|nr:hypothetical protein [Candidatus Saccharibacteria bacterium]HRQ07221.1 hypothetical protein [Candidatus Saccharibacteria bacterium]
MSETTNQVVETFTLSGDELEQRIKRRLDLAKARLGSAAMEGVEL